MFVPAASFVLVGLAACDLGQNDCTTNLVLLEVTVVDAAGAPVEGATVTAIHLKKGTTFSGATGPDGVSTAVTESLGAGTSRIVATLGDRTSAEVDVKWHCGDCHCVPAQPTLELVLP